MFISQMKLIVNAFERYAIYNPERVDYYKAISYEDAEKQVVEFFIDDYSLIAWLDDKDGLNIINSQTGESVFDYADEHGWSKDVVTMIKHGKGAF